MSGNKHRRTGAVALGSNLGDREANLAAGLRALERTPGVVVLQRSRWIETLPVGGPPGQPPFLNGAALVETSLEPHALLGELQRIEARYGRDRAREEHHGPRTLDLDLLFLGDLRLDGPDLVLPHPRMEERAFVLEPLAEVAPGRVLAISGRTVAERLAELRGPGPTLVRFETPQEAGRWCRAEREAGRSLGFVPTMGALHEGHLALVERALSENDRACVSVFVNPLQFDDPEDLRRYPRDMDADASLLASAGCHMVFTGTLAQFFPEAPGGSPAPEALIDPGPAAGGLEGEHRPGHFAGVATIVDRLFDVVLPTRAYFGQKDFQQTLVVRELARRRGGPEVVVFPTVREPSGLACSSRNALLSAADQPRALALWAALGAASELWKAGVRDARTLSARMRAELEGQVDAVEYAEVRDPDAWSSDAPPGPLSRAVALIAAQVGGVRLIDNLVLA